MVPRFLFTLLGLLLVPPDTGAQPQISNRDPKADEVGYRPADGSTTLLNPPSFIWLHEPATSTYTVEWASNPDFANAQSRSNLLWNTYTHNRTLAPGTYWWRYRFATPSGEISNWSRARKVVVPERGILFPMPDRAEQRMRVPAQHPRLFMRPEDVPKLRELARGNERRRFEELRAEADRIMQAGPTPEPERMGSARNKEDAEAVKYWWPNRVQTEKACMEAETLAFVYLMTGDQRYGEAARKWVLHLASWNPDGPTNFKLNCEAGKPLLFRPARAYDWAWDMFTAEERRTVRAITQRRIQDAWESGEVGRGVGHLSRPFNSHGNRTWHKVGEAGIAFLGEVPEAEDWLDYAVNKFYACYPVWSDDQGGWHEGVNYWAGYLGKAVWWLQVAQSALGIDGLQKPFFAHVGDYPLYVAPPHSPNAGFGDLSHRPPPAGAGSFLDYFVRMKSAQADGDRAAYWRWWMEQWRMKGADGILGFLYSANLPALPAAKAPTDLPSSQVFEGIGVASLHTTLLDAREDVHLLFKSSPFGTQSHGHNPHNTFQLNAYGEALLTTCVYRDLHGSKFHYEWAHSTVAHNGVLVNGEGQIKHTAAPHGRIVNASLNPTFDYIMGDATAAYGNRLKRYHRHVAFIKSSEPFILVYDDLEASEPSTFQFMLHGLSEFQLDAENAVARVQQPKAGLTARYLSREALRFRQWDGFDPPPSREFPNQWHVEAATTEKHARIGMLTLLVPYKGDWRVDPTAERFETDQALGAKIHLGGKWWTVAFRKAQAPATWELEGNPVSGLILVR